MFCDRVKSHKTLSSPKLKVEGLEEVEGGGGGGGGGAGAGQTGKAKSIRITLQAILFQMK